MAFELRIGRARAQGVGVDSCVQKAKTSCIYDLEPFQPNTIYGHFPQKTLSFEPFINLAANQLNNITPTF
jgi:hypothetical protein